MIRIIGRCCAILSLFCLWQSIPAYSARIDPNDSAAAIPDSLGISPQQDKRFLTLPLFDFSPFHSDGQTIVPGFADPLGTGIDPGLRIFAGRVQFMDLLGNFSEAKPASVADIELPPRALRGIDILDNFIAMYLSYNGRAFDKSLWDLETTEVIQRNGLPVTSETSPLSLAGFGKVAENLKPFLLHWTQCPEKEKREKVMVKSAKKGAHPCTTPGVCMCYVI